MPAGCHPKLSVQSYQQVSPFNASVGLMSATFALAFTPGPEHKAWDGLKGYPLIHGAMYINGTTFAGAPALACLAMRVYTYAHLEGSLAQPAAEG